MNGGGKEPRNMRKRPHNNDVHTEHNFALNYKIRTSTPGGAYLLTCKRKHTYLKCNLGAFIFHSILNTFLFHLAASPAAMWHCPMAPHKPSLASPSFLCLQTKISICKLLSILAKNSCEFSSKPHTKNIIQGQNGVNFDRTDDNLTNARTTNQTIERWRGRFGPFFILCF